MIGALLAAGLFLFLKGPSEKNKILAEKPSQLDFKASNQLPAPTVASRQASGVTQVTATMEEKSAVKLQGSDLSQWQVFNSILETKNDNDPRTDLQLKKLSPLFHQALIEKYGAMPAENRNGKGFITFLVARDLNSVEDIQFLKKVYEESPCLSLADCQTTGPDDSHHSSTNQVTLVYPQMNSLYQIENQLATRPELLNNPATRAEITQLLVKAENFPVAMVHKKASEIRARFGL